MKKQILFSIFLVFLVFLIFLPRLLSLTLHWSSDESVWMERSRDFVIALEQGKFEDTLTTHHPGVTTMWLGAGAIRGISGKLSASEWVKSYDLFTTKMLAIMRLPIAFLAGVLILLIGGLLYRLFGPLVAAVGTLFLAIEPFLLAHSRSIHTDVLTAEFLFLALLLWFCYLEDVIQKRRDLVFSGICFGLACLTKSHASVFLLFLPFLLLWYIKQRGFSVATLLMSSILFCSTALLTVLSTWPYLWTFKLGNIPTFPFLYCSGIGLLIWGWRKLSKPVSFSRLEQLILYIGLFLIVSFACYATPLVLGKMYDALMNAHENPKLFLGKIRYNTGALFYPVMAIVWSAPLAIPLMIASLYGAYQQKHKNDKVFRITIVLIFFSLFYLIGLSVVAKKNARYFIIYLPAVSLLSTMGAIFIGQQFSKKRVRYLLLLAIVVLQIAPVLRLHPYYVTYHFPLLSGKWISNNITRGYGAGLDVAGDYLNAKPDAENLNVRISMFSKNFEKYFVGKTWRHYRGLELNDIDFDYDVEYSRIRQIQGIPIDSHPKHGNPAAVFQFQYILPRELEHVVKLNGVDYVWIYRVLNTDQVKID